MAIKRVIHAGRVTISFGAKIIGYATGLNPSEDWGLGPQYAIGSIFPYEIVPLRFLGTLTINMMIIEKQLARDAGIPSGKDAAALDQAIKDLLTNEGVNITVTDVPSQKVLLSITGAKCGTQNFTITPNAICTRNATFQYKLPIKESPADVTADGYILPRPAST